MLPAGAAVVWAVMSWSLMRFEAACYSESMKRCWKRRLSAMLPAGAAVVWAVMSWSLMRFEAACYSESMKRCWAARPASSHLKTPALSST